MKHKIIAMGVALISVTACDVIRDEFQSPGGYPAVQADGFVKAVTMQQHVDRYRTFLYFSGSMALHSAHDEESAKDTIEHVKTALRRIEEMQTAIGNCGYSDNTCTFSEIEKSSFSFERHSLGVQRSLQNVTFDLVRSLGVRLDLKNLSLTDVAALGKYVLNIKDQFGALREAAATYRDMTQLFARSVAYTCVPRAKNPGDAAKVGPGVTFTQPAQNPKPNVEGSNPVETVQSESIETSTLDNGNAGNSQKPTAAFLTNPNACTKLRVALTDLYVNGKYEPQPSLAAGDAAKADRRLLKIFNLTTRAVEERLGAKSPAPTASYWNAGYRDVAKAYLLRACKDAARLYETEAEENEACNWKQPAVTTTTSNSKTVTTTVTTTTSADANAGL